MPAASERAHLERMLRIYRGNLGHLEQQAAAHGGEAHAPLLVKNQLADTREKIAELEQRLGLAPAPQPAPQPAPAPAPAPAAVQVVPIALEFRRDPAGDRITWRSPLFGREETPFAAPYRDDELPAVIKALDLLQYVAYPEPANDEERRYFALADAERAALAAHGLWRDGRVPADAPRLVGRALWAALGDRGRALLKSARNTAVAQGLQLGYCLRFPPEAVALVALPWELLWDADTNQALLIRGAAVDSCERYLDMDIALPPPLPAAERPHLLALVPDYGVPEALQRAERAARLQTWGALRDRGLLTFDELNPVSVARVNDYLLSAPRRPDVIHYYGHGLYRDGGGYLQLDGRGAQAELVGVERLAPLFGAARLVVVFACQSATVAGAGGLLSGVGPALSTVAGAVVAMQLTVRVAAATRFSQVFYQLLLGQGASVQEAVGRARQVLFSEASGGDSWYVPALYIRSREQRPVYLRA